MLNFPVMAYSDFYAENDILFYSLNASSNCGSSITAGTTAQVFGTTAAEKVWNGLKSLGFNNEQTAGLMGNLQAESGFSPIRLEGGSDKIIGERGGYGLAQWTSSGRRKGFIQALIDHGFSQYTDPNNSADEIYHKVGQTLLDSNMLPNFDSIMAVNLDYLMYELNNGYDHVLNYLNNPSSFDGNYLVSDSEYTNASITNLSVAKASEIVVGRFEIPQSYIDKDKSAIINRAQMSQSFYDQFNDGTGSASDLCPPTMQSSIVIGDISQPSENVQCDPRTVDLGVHEGSINGEYVQTRLCLVPNIASNRPAEQDIETPKRSNAVVSSRVAGAFYQMAADAAASGNPLRVGSSFRTRKEQFDLSGGGSGSASVAAAGHSAHEAGLAVDFQLLCGSGLDIVCDKEFYPWIKQNSKKYMIDQYNREYWHFSARSFLSNGKSG